MKKEPKGTTYDSTEMTTTPEVKEPLEKKKDVVDELYTLATHQDEKEKENIDKSYQEK